MYLWATVFPVRFKFRKIEMLIAFVRGNKRLRFTLLFHVMVLGYVLSIALKHVR